MTWRNLGTCLLVLATLVVVCLLYLSGLHGFAVEDIQRWDAVCR